jgi:putative hydrolase of the HAD superfamily
MRPIEHYEAIIFDRDGTLLQIEPERAATLTARCIQAAPQLSPTALTACWQGWPGPWPAAVDDEPAFWVDFWAALVPTHNLTPEQCQALATIAADYHTMFVAYPDAAPLVRQIRAHGLRLAVLTNFDLPSVDRTLQIAGLDPAWFDVRCSSVSLSARKPDPRAFLEVAATLQVAPERCLVVDDLTEHCEGARAAGMDAVYLDRAGVGGGVADVPCRASLADLGASLGL